MNDQTLLLRQVNPDFYVDNRVTSQAFDPMADDDGEKRDSISVYDGDQISPEMSWMHFVKTRSKRSRGVVGVQVQECAELNLSILPDGTPFKEHVTLSFGDKTGNQTKKLARRLARIADERGWLFEPEAE